MRRVIYYRPIERHWYRLLDWWLPKWERFTRSRWGWFVGKVIVLILKLAFWLGMVITVVGAIVLYSFLSFALGNGKLAKAMSRAGR